MRALFRLVPPAACAAALFVAFSGAVPAFAQASSGDGNGPPPGRPHGPPPEAIAACQGKAVGETASFTDRGGRTISGACTQMGQVVAVPPPRRGQGPDMPPPPDGQ